MNDTKNRCFIFYDPETGQIRQVAQVNSEEAELMEADLGLPKMESKDFNVTAHAHYIDKGKPVAMPKRPSKQHRFDFDTKEWSDAHVTYGQKRAAEYPPVTEFIDAMYWNSLGDPTKLEAYNAKCAAVKAKYPKPK